MKLLFIQGGSRLKEDNNGNWYTDGNFNNSVWKRYRNVSDNLTVILRKENKIYEENYCNSKFNKFDTNSIKLVPVKDLYKPLYSYFNMILKKQIYNTIYEEILNVDAVIIRSVINYYTITALKICKKLNKPYLIEVTGVAWDANWYHSLHGKFFAPFAELGMKRRLKDAKYALYVTQYELQNRYPCSGKRVGCSNVELENIDENSLINKLNKLNKNKGKYIIGSIGNYTLKTKGQIIIIKALGKLKKRGISNIELQLIGSGDNKVLLKEAQKQDVLDQIKFLGSIPHEEIFHWLEKIDIYVQASYQEGLCRSVVEAMSKACPVICSDACGESELTNKDFIFKRGNYYQLADKIEYMLSSNEIIKSEINRSFEKSKDYKKEILDERRKNFYIDFIENSKENK